MAVLKKNYSSCGMYLNTVFGDEFWVNEPERYPKGYYGFSSKVRIHAFLGQRITYDIDPQRRFYRKTALFYLQAPGKVVLLDGECQLGTFGVIFGQYSEEYVCFPLVSPLRYASMHS